MPELTPLPENPLVSIVVPSFNQGAFIRETIQSCLDQDYRPIEIIVVDGASTDDTVEVLKSFGDIPELNWVSEPDDGVVDAVNKGGGMARGELCGIQSSDDAYCPGALREAVEVFRQHPAAALVYGDCNKTDVEGRELGRWVAGPFSVENFLSKLTVVLQPAAFFRTDVFRGNGGWSADYFNADTECWLRMIMRYPAVKENAFWGQRRMHPEQRDQQGEKIIESYSRMMEQNPDLRTAPRRLRRAARCGVLLHTVRYGSLTPAQNRRLRLKAVLLWPPVRRTLLLRTLLLPGFVQTIISRLQSLRGRHG